MTAIATATMAIENHTACVMFMRAALTFFYDICMAATTDAPMPIMSAKPPNTRNIG